jgi:hypothetical protein
MHKADFFIIPSRFSLNKHSLNYHFANMFTCFRFVIFVNIYKIYTR